MRSAGPHYGRGSRRHHRHLYRPDDVRLDQGFADRLGVRRKAGHLHLYDCNGAGDRGRGRGRQRRAARGRVCPGLGANASRAMDRRAIANAARRLLDGQSLLAAGPYQGNRG